MKSFGHYTILERLRVGALGELVRARDVRLGRTVALRLVSPAVVEDAGRREALLAAAGAAAALSHPHITALFDFGEEDGQVFLAHEFVPGQSLRSLLTGKPVEASLALEFAVQLADALAEGHRQGVVHGDICPSTIFITPTDQTKIIGFGLADWTSGGTGRRTIVEQLAAGRDPDAPVANAAVPYMAPEQLLAGRTDHRADVFSLGVVLYEMLTGRAPFGSSTAGATAVKVLQGTPPPPSRQNKSVPVGFDAIVAKALAKSFDARYSSASEMVADLRVLAAGLNVRVTAEVPRRAKEKPARPMGPLLKRLAVAVLLLALVGALGSVAWTWRDRIAALFASDKAIPSPVLIVMPFQMAGGEPGREYFGVGFAEDLAARLGEVQGLTVVGRSSIAGSPGLSMTERASIAGAAVALRGTTRPGPYSLHVSAELVNVTTGQVIWSENYSREPRQASAAEVEIARQVADRLRLQIPTGNRWVRAQGRQVDPGAYDLYLQGRAAARLDRTRAAALYRQAIDMDPKLSEARVGLSEALYFEAMDAGSPGDLNGLDQARREAEAALSADAELPRAHLALALSATTVSTAASALARALSLDPSCGEAWHHAGDLVLEGDPARAITYYQRALELDPALDISRRAMAAAHEMLDRFGDAETELGLGEIARPDRPWWKQMRARVELARRNYTAATETLANDLATEAAPTVWLVGLIMPVATMSQIDEARKGAAGLTERYPGFCEGQAVLAALEWDSDGKAKGRSLTDAIFARADAQDAPPRLLPCAALASAAINDGPRAAGYVAKLAANDQALRAWTRPDVFTMSFAFRRELYPWNKVEPSGPFRQARAVLMQGLSRLRDETARRLPAPPRPPGRQ
jgi:serine/threonine protein kinase/tetratricopeptide (TPR) repeat protein